MVPDHTFNLDGLTLDLPVQWETEWDDDGGPNPSRSGNSMTGRRGKRRVAYLSDLGERQRVRIACKIADHVADQLAELVENAE